MIKYVRTLALTVGLLGGGFGLVTCGGPTAVSAKSPADKKERHPHIHRAIGELREARHELKEADHDFGGHRKEALEAVDVAIKQLELALKYDKK
jgi:hypothetical protein